MSDKAMPYRGERTGSPSAPASVRPLVGDEDVGLGGDAAGRGQGWRPATQRGRADVDRRGHDRFDGQRMHACEDTLSYRQR